MACSRNDCTPIKRRILFAEPDPSRLGIYVSLLDAERDHWGVLAATRAAPALELMGGPPLDVVVTDLDVPGMGGAAWMNEVRVRCANASRIIVSEIIHQEEVARCLICGATPPVAGCWLG